MTEGGGNGRIQISDPKSISIGKVTQSPRWRMPTVLCKSHGWQKKRTEETDSNWDLFNNNMKQAKVQFLYVFVHA